MAKGRPKSTYRVFVSHASDDIWVAEQIANSIEQCGAHHSWIAGTLSPAVRHEIGMARRPEEANRVRVL
jgi:hypothetical protein